MTNRKSAIIAIAALALGAAIAPASAKVAGMKPGKGHSNKHSHDHARPGKHAKPLVIGHRGASGYRPEHTLLSYELAARQGADFIEPDLVSTKDGVLVARHENEISGTTDVATRPEFATRKTTKSIDGENVTGWFTEDFTLAELKTLTAVERLPQVRPNNTIYNGLDKIPTLDEVLELRQRLSKELGRDIGVYPETKHPTYFQKAGLPLERNLVATLERHGLNRSNAPVFVQSFELTNLIQMDKQFGLKTPTVFLIWKSGAPFDMTVKGDARDYAHFASHGGMQQLAAYGIDGVGPEMSLVISWKADGTLGSKTRLVEFAHAYGMLVHAYTFRNENTFLPKDFRIGDDPKQYGNVMGLEHAYLDAGIDGFFTDQPDTGVVARNAWVAAQGR